MLKSKNEFEKKLKNEKNHMLTEIKNNYEKFEQIVADINTKNQNL